MRKNLRILALNVEEGLRTVLSEVFEENGFEMTEAASGEEALTAFERNPFPLVIADIGSWGSSGTEIFQKIKLLNPDTQVIIITTNTALDTAVSTIRSDTYDYLFKPFEDLDLVSAVTKRAIEKIRLIAENQRLLGKLKKQNGELAKASRRDGGGRRIAVGCYLGARAVRFRRHRIRPVHDRGRPSGQQNGSGGGCEGREGLGCYRRPV